MILFYTLPLVIKTLSFFQHKLLYDQRPPTNTTAFGPPNYHLKLPCIPIRVTKQGKANVHIRMALEKQMNIE